MLGIDPATENALTCGNIRIGHAKRREMTCGYSKGVDDVNTRRLRHGLLVRFPDS